MKDFTSMLILVHPDQIGTPKLVEVPDPNPGFEDAKIVAELTGHTATRNELVGAVAKSENHNSRVERMQKLVGCLNSTKNNIYQSFSISAYKNVVCEFRNRSSKTATRKGLKKIFSIALPAFFACAVIFLAFICWYISGNNGLFTKSICWITGASGAIILWYLFTVVLPAYLSPNYSIFAWTLIPAKDYTFPLNHFVTGQIAKLAPELKKFIPEAEIYIDYLKCTDGRDYYELFVVIRLDGQDYYLANPLSPQH